MEPELDFDLLDDVLPVISGSADAASAVGNARLRTIGPLTEYTFQARANPACMPPLSGLPDGPLLRELRRVLERGCFGGMPFNASHQAREAEFHWLPTSQADFACPAWVMFQRRLQDAARRAGFAGRVPAGLTGAFGEMADNAFRHSLAPRTGIGGYAWSEGRFEYVVADAGCGVLASLRSCTDYSYLDDSGDALELALAEGESRFGKGSGHGLGFRALFLSLMNLNGCLRFRSGDHALTIDGTSPDLSQARLSQVGIDYAGFLVSVVCRPD